MPGGEQSTDGAINTKLFAGTVENFGWVLVNRQDKNLPCSVCQPSKNGVPKEHGVDLLFSLDCPFTKTKRGVYVDGKRYKFSSVKSSKTMKGWLDSARTVTKHLNDSQHLFRETLDLPTDFQIDTGIVAWDCYKDWDPKVAETRREDVTFSGSDQPPINILFLFKNHLDRLATIKNFKEKCSHLEFLYRSEQTPSWHPVLLPELLMSSWWPICFKKNGEDRLMPAIIAFDLPENKDVLFSVPIHSYLGLSTHEHVTIFLPDVSESDAVQCQTLIDASVKNLGLSSKIACQTFDVTTYKS